MSRVNRHPAHHSRTMAPLELPADAPDDVLRVWGSRDYLATLWLDPNGYQRLSINSTTYDTRTGRWADGLTWDELMAVKNQCGFAAQWCVEVYPPKSESVDVASIRHLWLLDDAPGYAWNAQEAAR